MEIRIGIQNVSREIVIESQSSAEDVEKAVADALENDKPLLTLEDRREKKIVVPVRSIGYVEIGSDTRQTVGFAAVAE